MDSERNPPATEGKITYQNGVRDRDFFAIFWDFLDFFWDFFWIFGIFGIFLGDFWDLLDFFSEKCTGFFLSDFPLAHDSGIKCI